MRCPNCGSLNIAPSKMMYECRDCGSNWGEPAELDDIP